MSQNDPRAPAMTSQSEPRSPNPRLQRTRLRAPLSRKTFGGTGGDRVTSKGFT